MSVWGAVGEENVFKENLSYLRIGERYVEVFGVGGAGGRGHEDGDHVDFNELREDGMEGGGGGTDLPIDPRLDGDAVFGKH